MESVFDWMESVFNWMESVFEWISKFLHTPSYYFALNDSIKFYPIVMKIMKVSDVIQLDEVWLNEMIVKVSVAVSVRFSIEEDDDDDEDEWGLSSMSLYN